MYTTSQVAPRYRSQPIPRGRFARQTMGDFAIPGVTTPYQPNAPFVFYKTPAAPASSPKMNPASNNLDEVQVTAQYATATPYADAAMPEIAVTAKRIPWTVWVVLGAVGAALLLGVLRK